MPRKSGAPSFYTPQTITVELIRKASKRKAPESPKEIRDRAHGLILRHQPSGYLSLYVELGRGKRERLCNARDVIAPNTTLTLGRVRNEAKRLRGETAGGRDFKRERAEARAVPTFAAYLKDTYGPWVTSERRAGAETLRKLERIAESGALGSLKLTELTAARLQKWRAKRKREVSAVTLKQDLAVLRAALGRAVKLELIKTNPLAGIEMPEVDRSRRVVRALTADEKAALVAALAERDAKKRAERVSANRWREKRGYGLLPAIGTFADVLTPAVVIALETGLRRGEQFALEWPRVDFDERVLHIEGATTKTFETRNVPLNERAYRTLRDWWLQCGQPKTGYVFALEDRTADDDGEPVGSLKKSYHAVLKAAGIERVNAAGKRVNWHSLRHTFGSLLAASGVDLATIKELMGHSNIKTTERYLHTDEKRKRAAVAMMDGPAAERA